MKNSIKFILLIAIIVGGLSCGKTVLEPADAPSGPPKKLGEYYQGGYVVYLETNKIHGIIAAPVDLFAVGSSWSSTNIYTGANYYGIYEGLTNTNLIISYHGTGNYPASLCDQLSYDGYNDWYLPSKSELENVYSQKSKLGLNSSYYWSSTEYSATQAYACNFSSGNSVIFNKTNWSAVCAVRKF